MKWNFPKSTFGKKRTQNNQFTLNILNMPNAQMQYSATKTRFVELKRKKHTFQVIFRSHFIINIITQFIIDYYAIMIYYIVFFKNF